MPADKATIQAAIDDPNCSPILVAAGTYVENLIITRDLTLQGADRDTTIINGNRVGVVISITNGAAPTIDGFTITGGDGSTNNPKGKDVLYSVKR